MHLTFSSMSGFEWHMLLSQGHRFVVPMVGSVLHRNSKGDGRSGQVKGYMTTVRLSKLPTILVRLVASQDL